MRELVLDWRNTPDLSRSAEAYSVSANQESSPSTGNPQGKVLVSISATIQYGPDGSVADRPYNKALWRKVVDLGASTNKVVFRGDNGYSTVLFDLTKRGMVREWLKLLDVHFPWADGFHMDYASAWSWAFPDMAAQDEAWDAALVAIANALRSKGKLALYQQFHLTNPVMAASGAFVEQSPFAWGYSLAEHANELKQWRDMVRRVDPRPELWVFEVRDYLSWPDVVLNAVKKWSEEQDVLLCLGRK